MYIYISSTCVFFAIGTLFWHVYIYIYIYIYISFYQYNTVRVLMTLHRWTCSITPSTTFCHPLHEFKRDAVNPLHQGFEHKQCAQHLQLDQCKSLFIRMHLVLLQSNNKSIHTVRVLSQRELIANDTNVVMPINIHTEELIHYTITGAHLVHTFVKFICNYV